jgi:hypothetical protein
MAQIRRQVHKHSPGSEFLVTKRFVAPLPPFDLPPSRQNSTEGEKKAGSPVILVAKTGTIDGVKVLQTLDVLVDTSPPGSPESGKKYEVVATITTVHKKVVRAPQDASGTDDLMNCQALNVVTDPADTYSLHSQSQGSDYSELDYISGSTSSQGAFSPGVLEDRLLHTRSEDALNEVTPEIPSRTGSYGGATIIVNSHDSFNFTPTEDTEPVSRRSSAAPRFTNKSKFCSVDDSKTVTMNPVPFEYNLYNDSRVKQDCVCATMKRTQSPSWDDQSQRIVDSGDNGSPHSNKQPRPSAAVELVTTQSQVIHEVNNALLQQLGVNHPSYCEAVDTLLTSMECPVDDDRYLDQFIEQGYSVEEKDM